METLDQTGHYSQRRLWPAATQKRSLASQSPQQYHSHNSPSPTGPGGKRSQHSPAADPAELQCILGVVREFLQFASASEQQRVSHLPVQIC